MPPMKQKHILRLESQLEQLVESAFANLFNKRIRARDLALELARAMESGVTSSSSGDTRSLAPDQYVIHLHSEVHQRLLAKEPRLATILSGHLVEMATFLGFQLAKIPSVKLVVANDLVVGKVVVTVAHSERSPNSTLAMERVEIADASPESAPETSVAQLIIGDGKIVSLQAEVVNVGRDRENHIVLEDPYVSRHHMQLRLREGGYLLFDVNSHAGTFVNNVRVREHRLQSGDVIYIGKTQILYLEEPSENGDEINQTQALDPYE